MFAKPYKLKSNNTLKNTEKKHLAKRIQDEFPQATEDKVKEIVSVKSTCICMKLVLHSGELVNVYAVDGVPMILEMEQGLAPTVCALWKVPDLVPTLTIHGPVLNKIQGGAPLYLPGVELPAGGIGFPLFQRGTIIAACTTDNSAACLIGRSTMSSADMLLRAAGVCLDTLHVLGDLLCKDAKFSKIERPKMPPAVYRDIADSITADVGQLSIQKPREEWPSLGKQDRIPTPTAPTPAPALAPALGPALAPTPAPVPNEPRIITDNGEDNDEDTETAGDDSMLTEEGEGEDEIPTDMDGLLRWCLVSFLKLEGKNVELPIRTSLLYRNHLVPLCPSDRTLDVKKSSYKKMSKFLEAMQQEGFIEVREIEKGVDAVTVVQTAHPSVRAHRVARSVRERARADAHAHAHADTASREYTPPQVREMYCVTAHVADIFVPLKKGTAVTASQVRTSVSEYVRAHSLTSPHTKGAVSLNPTLAKIAGKNENEVMRWEELIPAVQAAMTASTEMRFADGSVRLTKTRLEPVKMQVANRSGNKKVTLVSNLESFGFSLAGLAHACQLGVAASCGVTRTPGAKSDQLMLQGDQTHFVAKLLIEKYGLPKKFVEGADKALNKKK